jgi:hypothetical protein
MQPLPASAARNGFWFQSAAVLSLLAGFVHIIAAPPYFDIWVGYGLFFALAITAQMTLAVVLWVSATVWMDGPRPGWLWAGILGNGLIVALWLYTRTVGIPPFGPQAGLVLPVGALDLISAVAEVGLIVSLLLARRETRRGFLTASNE